MKTNGYSLEKYDYKTNYLSLNENLTYLELRKTKNGVVQNRIRVDTIINIVIPPQVISIIRSTISKEKAQLKQDLVKGKNTGGYYQFYLELVNGVTLELVSRDCQTLKIWVMGINSILNNKTIIEKFQGLIGSILRHSF